MVFEPLNPLPLPHPPSALLKLRLRLPVSHQCSPFFSAAVMESPSLFPVMNTRCLAPVAWQPKRHLQEADCLIFLPPQHWRELKDSFPEAHSLMSWLWSLWVIYINHSRKWTCVNPEKCGCHSTLRPTCWGGENESLFIG